MKKQIVLAVALSVSAFSFSQKKELKAAEKAIKSENFSEAKTALNQVEPMLESLDEKSKAKYKYLKGVALFSKGTASEADIDKSLEYLNAIEDNATYKVKVRLLKESMLKKFIKKGSDAFEKKEFASACNYFEKLYGIAEKDTTYLYNAAISAAQIPDYDRALPLYEKLNALNYTGIEERYFAVNNQTKVKELFPNKEVRDAAILSKKHNSPSFEKTASKRGDIAKAIALIYVSQGRKDKAVEAMKIARAQNPGDMNLLLSEANLYYEIGDKDRYKELTKQALEKDPNNANLQYNLGILNLEQGELDEAKKYFMNTLKINPENANAALSLSNIEIEKGNRLVKQMSDLGESRADNIKFEKLRSEKDSIFRNGVSILKDFISKNPTPNADILTQLKNIYAALGETAKVNEMKQKIAAMAQ